MRSGGSYAPTPPSSNDGTPVSSPHDLGLSARSVGSNASSRSGRSARSGGGSGGRGYGYATATPLHGMPSRHAEQTRSWSSGSGANYVTPNSSARMSEFGSVYDGSSARTADLGSVYENQPTSADYAGYYDTPEATKKPSRKKKGAYTAALDAFAPSASKNIVSGNQEPEVDEVSLDPRQVFSSARHGRHKEVEASLAAGFDPAYADSFGNTLFHIACQNGVKRIAKLAIKYGGDMDAQNLKGNTGVHFLYSYGYQDIGEYFIEKGASDQILNDVGKTARQGIR